MEKAQTSEAQLRARLEPARLLLEGDESDGAALAGALAALDGAEVSHLLEMIPDSQRLEVWTRLEDATAAEVLEELPDLIASKLADGTPRRRLERIGAAMDIEQLSDALELFPRKVQERLKARLSGPERERLEAAMAYHEDSVGRAMSTDMLVFEGTKRIGEVLQAIRERGSFPEQTDQLFVVNAKGELTGVMRVTDLLLSEPDEIVADRMDKDPPRVRARESLEDAALLFERDNLVCAPVINRDGRLMGRLAVEEVMDTLRETSEETVLGREGLRGDEDLFGRVWESALRRWLWVCLSLLAAFVASRVIGLFEDSIQAMVVLASLVPIVASIAGSTGSQTAALMIRGLAMGHVTRSNLTYLAGKELAIALVNGVVWGGVLAAVLLGIYGDAGLSAVMLAAITLNLGVAALAGVVVPLGLHRLGRDPALGSSVVLFFITDSMGFFIFLSLGAAFLR